MSINVVDVHLVAPSAYSTPGLAVTLVSEDEPLTTTKAEDIAYSVAREWGYAPGGVGQSDFPPHRVEGLWRRVWWFTECLVHERPFCALCFREQQRRAK